MAKENRKLLVAVEEMKQARKYPIIHTGGKNQIGWKWILAHELIATSNMDYSQFRFFPTTGNRDWEFVEAQATLLASQLGLR